MSDTSCMWTSLVPRLSEREEEEEVGESLVSTANRSG